MTYWTTTLRVSFLVSLGAAAACGGGGSVSSMGAGGMTGSTGTGGASTSSTGTAGAGTTSTGTGGACNPVDPMNDGMPCGMGCPMGQTCLNPGICYLECDPMVQATCPCDRYCVGLVTAD